MHDVKAKVIAMAVLVVAACCHPALRSMKKPGFSRFVLFGALVLALAAGLALATQSIGVTLGFNRDLYAP